MPSNATRLREAFRSLLLPISPHNEAECIELLEQELVHLGLSPADHHVWINLQTDRWRDSGVPEQNFSRVIGRTLAGGHPEFGAKLSEQYFSLHNRLREDFFLSHDESSAFLSHALLMCQLAHHDFTSAAQIGRILSARDSRVHFGFRPVDMCINRLKVKQRFRQEDVSTLFERDSTLEELTLADSDLSTCINVLDGVAENLGFPDPFAPLLTTLARPADPAAYTPYLQMLHYQCVLAEFFDHAVTYLYEFNPRGAAANWLFSQYPDSMVSAGNPFLNNAKSVERAARGWAQSKKPAEIRGALALVAVLSGLESMGFSARRELATWIRLWLHRVIRSAEPLSEPLAEELPHSTIRAIMDKISLNETQTGGIIEQRAIDALTSLLHPECDGWHSRGLGDSVNASNTSKKKLGDVDYQHPVNRKVVAYEAHAGKLTEVYLEEHLRTLERILIARSVEWESFSDPIDWNITIMFVAHSFASSLPSTLELNGVHIDLDFCSFEDLVARTAEETPDLDAAFSRHVLAALNSKTTPARVRHALMALSS